MIGIRRREFITLLTAAAAPVATYAQSPILPMVGYLYVGSPDDGGRAAAFRKGLNEGGYVEDRNVTVEQRWGDNDPARLPQLLTDLIDRRVAVIATGDLPSSIAAKTATASIPIVFETAADPVQAGLVHSLNRPGGNVTGVTNLSVELGVKRLGILRELLPNAFKFAVLVNPDNPIIADAFTKDAQRAAAGAGRQLEILTAHTIHDIDEAFASVAQKKIDAILVMPDNLFNNRRVQLAIQAVHYAVPMMHYDRNYVVAGGLMSYGTNILDAYRQVGIYTARILKGEKPGDLPVQQPTKFELVINLQSARALGIALPPTLLALADEVIE
jgi:putative ABC transport system substrate-binding protein